MDWILFNALLGIGGLAVLCVLSALCYRIPWRWLMNIIIAGLVCIFVAIIFSFDELGTFAGTVVVIAGLVMMIGRPDEYVRGLNGEQDGKRT